MSTVAQHVERVFSYLGERQNDAHGPGDSQHDFALPLGLADAKGVEDGRLSVQTDDYGHEGARVHGHEFHEHQQSAGDVSRLPLHRDVPHRVHGHHDERHQQVGHRQVHDQDPDVGLALAAVAGGPEHHQVADGRHGAQAEGDDDPSFGRRGEGGQLERVSLGAPVALRGDTRTGAVHRLIRQLVEHCVDSKEEIPRKSATVDAALVQLHPQPQLSCGKKINK